MMILLLTLACPASVRASDTWHGISQIAQNGKNVNLYVNLPEEWDASARDSFTVDSFTVAVNGGPDLALQEVSGFASLEEGICYVFVVDISKSLTEDEMQQVQSTLTAFVDALGSEDSMQIITAGEGTQTLMKKPVRKKKKLKEAIEQSVKRTAGYTYLYRAVSEALKTRSEYEDTLPERMVVVAITDGKDTSEGEVSYERLKEEILETRIPLYVVGLKGNDPSADLGQIRALAELSGGFLISGDLTDVDGSVSGAAAGESSVSGAVEKVRGLINECIRLTVRPPDEYFTLGEWNWTVTCRLGENTFTSSPYVYSLNLEEALAEEETDTELWESVVGEAETGYRTETDETESAPETILEAEPDTETGYRTETDEMGGAPETIPEAEPDTETGYRTETDEMGGVPETIPEAEPDSENGMEADETGNGTETVNIITCVASGLIFISLILILISLILWKKYKDFDDPEPSGEVICDDSYETLTDVDYPEEDATADSPDLYDDEKTIDEIDDMGVRMQFEITFDGCTEVAEYTLREQLVLGRGPECDVDVVLGSIVLERKRISRHHAYIINGADGLRVRDNAKNKTRINGVDVTGESVLQDGDILRMGGATVKVRIMS